MAKGKKKSAATKRLSPTVKTTVIIAVAPNGETRVQSIDWKDGKRPTDEDLASEAQYLVGDLESYSEVSAIDVELKRPKITPVNIVAQAARYWDSVGVIMSRSEAEDRVRAQEKAEREAKRAAKKAEKQSKVGPQP